MFGVLGIMCILCIGLVFGWCVFYYLICMNGILYVWFWGVGILLRVVLFYGGCVLGELGVGWCWLVMIFYNKRR